MAEFVERKGCLQLCDVMGLFRPWTNQGKVAIEHVEALRKLIDMEPAQDSTEPGDARILRLSPCAATQRLINRLTAKFASFDTVGCEGCWR